MKSLITPRVQPTPAMMNPNSPSCARLNPVWTALSKPLPVRMMPAPAKMMWLIITITESSRIIAQCSAITDGATIIPTETKNMAPKRFLIGSTMWSMCSLSEVSARMDPITKAPSADENPTDVARATIPKQRPILTIRRISLLRYSLAFFSRVGMT